MTLTIDPDHDWNLRLPEPTRPNDIQRQAIFTQIQAGIIAAEPNASYPVIVGGPYIGEGRVE